MVVARSWALLDFPLSSRSIYQDMAKDPATGSPALYRSRFAETSRIH